MAKKNKKNAAPQVFETEAEIRKNTYKRLAAEKQRDIEKPKPDWEKKVENFWYHYKTHIFIGLLFSVIGGFFLWDTVLAPKPDMKIIMVTSAYYPAEMQDTLKAELEKHIPDINNDGKTMVMLDYMLLNSTPLVDDTMIAVDGTNVSPQESAESPSSLSQDEYAYAMKLMAVIASNDDQVFILDEVNYKYISSMGDGVDIDVFLNLENIKGAAGDSLPVNNTALASSPDAEYYEGISFYLRNLPVDSKNAEMFANNEKFIESLTGGQ